MKPRRASDCASRPRTISEVVASSTRLPRASVASTLWPSSLPAFTAWRNISPVEIAGTPRREASSAACVPFPEPGGPKSSRRSAASAPDPPPLHEALVVAHHQLALDLLQEVHRHADDDEQRGAAEVEADAEALGDEGRQEGVKRRPDAGDRLHLDAGEQELGQDGYRRQVERAHQRDAGEHGVDVLRRALAGADAGDEAAVLPHVF